ncbi:unnamed protein product [Clonostachys solani]|uniref:Uncharacterized protein n=1 Tax=Clonostachys solani TaxID=160281 RepID=A0A9N9ZPV2_9HYPO|nr:unnamed protein product [Clonostachys solani]
MSTLEHPSAQVAYTRLAQQLLELVPGDGPALESTLLPQSKADEALYLGGSPSTVFMFGKAVQFINFFI